ncbi:UDP-N-acetyl-D-mannosamine dehydrogenase [Marinomonas foliarum]|uniref:UDP-N-acetyl-D-mannosamine dehydrogenase n=1 Tax=Marinomonas foliarum TaxID=491950 RepID=A0ABX7IS72_9GAMM|nr:UDP-N-acetyl-D-mannosamine dehydrogenase [Marinomonas foliarum]QRV25197.1 UDP-N-acetyl-D-mannosamine dehydrogenase [Marinomonas foliarum]
MSFDTVSVIGLGYIGLPTAAMFASRKIKVIGVDVCSSTVDIINQGRIHIVEPDLDMIVHAAVSEGYLQASLIPETAGAYLVAVPTPFIQNKDCKTPTPDLSFINSAIKAIASVLKAGDLVVLESTSPVGTTEQVRDWLSELRPDLKMPYEYSNDQDIFIAHCPERVLPGQIVRELVENDRVIGGITSACSERAVELYSVFVKGKCIVTNARTAEMAKLTENSSRDVQIAFANELSIICDSLDINVWELIELANRHPRVNILQPGPGVGGHCIAVDPWFIVSKSPKLTKLIRTAREVNDAKPQWVIYEVKQRVADWLLANPSKSLNEVTVACYGLSFKPNIDDVRESPALEIAIKLSRELGGNIICIDPHVKRKDIQKLPLTLIDWNNERVMADIHVLLVKHDEFLGNQPHQGLIIDTTGAWSES